MRANIASSRLFGRHGRAILCVLLLLLIVPTAGLGLTWWRHRGAIARLTDTVPEQTEYIRHATTRGRPPEPRIWTPLESIAPVAVCAVLAAEDYTFFQHGAADPAMRSRVVAHMLRGDFAYGGSTIGEQLARNLFLRPERTPWRKAREHVLARQLSRRISKERQLELYLNLVQWGPSTWGIGAASRRWFGKPPAALTVTEAVLLAGVLPSPSLGLRRVAAPTAAPLRKRVLRRLWTARLLSGVARSAAVARLDRWAQHVRNGRAPDEARTLVDLEMGPEAQTENEFSPGQPWSARCGPPR